LVPIISDAGWPVSFSRAWFQCVIAWSWFKHEGGNGAALNDLGQRPLVFLQLARVLPSIGLGLFLRRTVPQGFDGPHHTAVGGLDGGGGEPAPLTAIAQLGEKNLRLVGTVDEFGFFPLATVEVPNLLVALLVQDNIGHGGPLTVPEGHPLVVGPQHLRCWKAGQLLKGPVPMGDHMVLVEDESRNRAALDDLGQGSATLFKFVGVTLTLNFGVLSIGDVPQGFDGAGDRPVGRPNRRGGKKKPLTVLAHFGEKYLRLVGAVDEFGWFPFAAVELPDFPLAATVQHDIGHCGPFRVPERHPMTSGAHHAGTRETGQSFQGLVPIGDDMVLVKDEGGDRAALDNLAQAVFALLDVQDVPAVRRFGTLALC
jgi:hypothetical protein